MLENDVFKKKMREFLKYFECNVCVCKPDEHGLAFLVVDVILK